MAKIVKATPVVKLRANNSSFPNRTTNSPFKEVGGSGTAVYSGYVEVIEKDPRLAGANRYQTYRDMMCNTSIVAAGLRFFLNLISKPEWKWEAPEGSETTEYTELVEEALKNCVTSWPRIVRKSGLFLFHGFSIQEWTAKKNKEGKIVFADIESRPQNTIERWDVNPQGTILGVEQRPAMGMPVYLDRRKLLYLVDDTYTDSPEGMGLFRNLIGPAETMKRYRELEIVGFDRDLRGIPIGKAPLSFLQDLVDKNQLSPEDRDKILQGLRNFVQMQAKGKATGAIIDSDIYEGMNADGQQPTAVAKWGLDLLQGGSTSHKELAEANIRLTEDMARIMGIEGVLLGSNNFGSMALSKDKSSNLYLNVYSTLNMIVEAVGRDLVDMLWALNGLPEEEKPKGKVGQIRERDISEVTAALREMATAGAVLAPDDPAIDEVRRMLALSPHVVYDPMAEAAKLAAVEGVDEEGGKPTAKDGEEDESGKKKVPPQKKKEKKPK